jgi:hypothetical protein
LGPNIPNVPKHRLSLFAHQYAVVVLCFAGTVGLNSPIGLFIINVSKRVACEFKIGNVTAALVHLNYETLLVLETPVLLTRHVLTRMPGVYEDKSVLYETSRISDSHCSL